MESKVTAVAVQIARFVDPHNPGVVECRLVDVEGGVHTFVDKVPIFTCELLDARSTYPQMGSVRCRVLAQSRDATGRALVCISTLWPDGIESTEGKSEFVVTAEQLLDS